MIGTTLGPYTIKEQLGAGGMAQVYRGRHIHLKRDVAIKVMHAHFSEKDDWRDRFLREAQANAALKHPGIVHIYDFDVSDGVCYIAMEMLDGKSLEDRVNEANEAGRAHFSLEETTQIVTEIGDALSYAHRHGVIHRDIKPSNIMMTVEGRAVLTDFGLAAVLEETRMTVDGTAAGTPSYMAPEQVAGERGDHRTDIYSLGVLCYRLLAGQLPFQSDTLVGMINKVLNEPAPSLRDTVPDLPAYVVDAVERSLAKDPSERFDSVAAMTAALRGESTGTETETAVLPRRTPAPASTTEDATLGVTMAGRRTPLRWWSAAAIVAVAVVGTWWMFGRADGQFTEREPPAVESMVAGGETTVPSMAMTVGWKESFDDNLRGWELSSGDISRSLADGHYEIDLSIGGQAVSAVAGKGGEFTDLDYSGSGRLIEGQPESGYGLVFRRRDARNYYVFAVNGLGQWSVWALEDGAWRELRGLSETWTAAEAVDSTGINRLGVRVVGDEITATVNGVKLVTLRDATFSSGAVGFYAASSRTAASPHTRVRFDDVETAVPTAPGADAPSMVRETEG